MIKDFHLQDIRAYLVKHDDTSILDAFDKIADAAIIFTPLMFGPQFLPVLELLDVKDKLIGLGKSIIEFIASKQEPDYLNRAEQIKVAYALICITAYFDAINDTLPKDLIKKLKLKFKDKKGIIEDSAGEANCPIVHVTQPDIRCTLPFTDHITSYSDTLKYLKEFYEKNSGALLKRISELGIEKKDPKRHEEIKKLLATLPQKAVEFYKAQYFYLANEFGDFAFFAQCVEFDSLQKASKLQSASIAHLKEMIKRIDVGFVGLCNVVNSISTDYAHIQAQDIVDDLRKAYRATIEQPIIDDKEIASSQEKIGLTFPKIINAFIPQSYKCISYQQRAIQLEDEATWKDNTIHDDLDRFFVKYLYSLDSTDYPLIILGHPGSGKSLLTKVLAAQLMSSAYTVIRIPLREINADTGIDFLVEEQIHKITNRPLPNGYGGFARQFVEKPLVIILDGYDELLQAKGDVFSGYLEKVRSFQQNQKQLERPVRVIVTSRITLIDKAIVPINSTILRLMEFDEKQRQTWINIWNEANSAYFNSFLPPIRPFTLPSSKHKSKKSSLIELAEQPLLLLMLALYDSDGNSLAQTNDDIKRTELYDNLLRRFVRRERGRYVTAFDSMSQYDQEVIIDKEMKRLAVVAIGMYNRRKLYIHSKELDSDLRFFESAREDHSSSKRTLKDSESLLGGFFFIHQSTAKDVSANSVNTDSAFEFLHNTFGEFLTADFILRFAVQEVNIVHTYLNNPHLASELNKKLFTPDGLCKDWFACLMFTPLYSRPVVIEMIQEHAVRVMNRNKISVEEFKENLKYIVKSQLRMILNTKEFPNVMTQSLEMNRNIPLLGYISIYTMNLVILASVLCPEGFEFNEDDYRGIEASSSETKPWDKLASLWRTWFSSEDLTGLSVILKAYREDKSKIIVRANEKFEAALFNKSIDILLCVSSTLADNLLVGLAGLQTQRLKDITKMSEREIVKLLEGENTELYYSYLISLLRNEINSNASDYDKINSIIFTIIDSGKLAEANRDILLQFFMSIEMAVRRRMLFFKTRIELVDFAQYTMRHIYKQNETDAAGICAMQIVQLITKMYPFSIDQRMMFDEPFFARDLFDVDINLDRPFLNFAHYKKNGFYGIQENINETDFINSIISNFDNGHFDNRETDVILKRFFSSRNVERIVQTDPESISRLLLLMTRKVELRKYIDRRTLERYFKSFLSLVEAIGIGNLEFGAIIYTIKLSKAIQDDFFLPRLLEVLEHQLFRQSQDYLLYFVYYYPSYISELIDLVPGFFDHINMIKNLDRVFMSKKVEYISIDKIIDYMRLYRKILNRNEGPSPELNEALRRYGYMACKIISTNHFEFEKLTIEQYGDIKWLARILKDKELAKLLDKKAEPIGIYSLCIDNEDG